MGSFDAAERALLAMGMPDEELGHGSSLRGFALAWLYADIGRWADAQTRATRLAEAGAARGLPMDEGRGRWALAEVLRRKGELAQADTEIQTAIAYIAMACPIDLPGAKATFAAIRLAQNRFADAVTAAEEGMSLYATMGACGSFRGAFLRLVHAECLEAAGRHEDARTAIAKARERLHVNAAKIQDPSYRASFLENVPENVRTLELSRQWLGDGV